MAISISGEQLPDPRTIEQLLAEQYKELAGCSVRFLAEGWDFAVYEVDGGWLCRLPKREEVVGEVVLESKLLPQLAPLLDVAVPHFAHVGVAGAHFPYPFVIYRKIEGVPARSIECSRRVIEVVAPALASALTALHGFPVERAVECGASVNVESLAKMRDITLKRLDSIADQLPVGLVARCRAMLDPDAVGHLSRPDASVLIHSDFNGEHILLDPNDHAVTGIIDWGDLEIGDPAADFAGLYGWGGRDLVAAVYAFYGRQHEEDALLERACFRALYAELHNLQHWLKSTHESYAAESRVALERVVGFGDQ